MQKKRGVDDAINRNQLFEERNQRFLNKIRAFQRQELKKIQQRSKDEIQFETNKIMTQSRDRDQQAFGKRHKTLQVETKIKKSRRINEARLSKMKMRFQMIEKVQNQIRTKLVESTSNDRNYRELLQKLIIQGMIKMLQQNIQIKCLARDVQIIKDVLPSCEKQFAQICEVKTKLTLNQQRLPESELGGIILTSFNGKIVCNNTLRARLDYAIQQSLPEVRKHLFTAPQSSSPQNKQTVTAH